MKSPEASDSAANLGVLFRYGLKLLARSFKRRCVIRNAKLPMRIELSRYRLNRRLESAQIGIVADMNGPHRPIGYFSAHVVTRSFRNVSECCIHSS
jgi:hypothetical protein